jgi:RNA polymerase sigma-70 factor (ECF subfamily)
MPDPSSNPQRSTVRSLDVGERRNPGDDRELLRGVGRRDQEAMAEIFDRYSRLVYSVALRVLNDAAQAEDVMQDIFVQLWHNPATFESERGSLPAWLAVVARNRAIDQIRRRKPSDAVEDVVLVSSTNLALEVEQQALIERVRQAMASLPAEQRLSLEMAFFSGLTHAEIAAQTGDPLGTVKTRIRTALGYVRRALQA